MKNEVCEVEDVVKTTEEMTEMKGALNKEKAEKREENEKGKAGRKLEYEALDTKLDKNIEAERRKIPEELAFVKDDMMSMKTRSCGALSSAASTGFGLGSRTIAPPPPLASWWQDGWVPRKIEVKGRVTDWSKEHIQGIQDDQTKRKLGEIEVAVAAEIKVEIDWAQSKEN